MLLPALVIVGIVETVGIASCDRSRVALYGSQFVVKDAIADFLRGRYFGGIARQAHFQRTDASKRVACEEAF